MSSKRQRAICLGRGPRRAIPASIAGAAAKNYATRRVGLRGPEQKDRLAERLGAEEGQSLDVSEGANDFEHELETILRTRLEGSETRLPCGTENLGEGHEPACRSATRRRDQAAVTQQPEQVVATSTNTGDPLRDELPTDSGAVPGERASGVGQGAAGSSHRLPDALEHEAHPGLLAGESVVGKDALTSPAGRTASQPDP